ncbi:BnaC01g36250D [Brassica napus]|uniref:BnaC01g36250D protein n=1 Tax=Brassica napus TaxID=3708 RepID=A0A078GAT3_BRANA|nr:BnaC01g36250D [Brassica napus]
MNMNVLSSSSPSHSNCGHWYVRHGICLTCKQKPSLVEESRRFDYLFTGLRLSQEAGFQSFRSREVLNRR